MIEIKCPDCETVGKMSLVQMIYEGPYRCWKCRKLFSIVIANNRLQSCQPMSEEEFEAWQALQKAMKKDSED